MNRIKKLPFYVKGIIIVILTAVLVIAAAAGLKLLEERQQKPRVLGAVASLAAGLADERYSMEKTYDLLRSGKLSCMGRLSVKNIEEGFLEEKYRFMVPYLAGTSLDYTVRKDENLKRADIQLRAALHGTVPVELEGYLDEEECIIHIPGFHKSYLSFSPDNMKQQYESSLLHTVLGDRLSLPQEDLSEYVFCERAANEEKENFAVRLERSAELVRKLYKEITVVKTKQKEDILWNGSYESCTVYELTVPAAVINSFLDDSAPELAGHAFAFAGESIPAEVCLNSGRRILKLQLAGTLLADERKIPVLAVLYPKGVENPWDSMLLTLELTWEDAAYGFQLVRSNEFMEEGREFHTSLSMTHPYVMNIADADMEFDKETGEMSVDFACTTPAVTMDGIVELAGLEDAVEKPVGESVRIFELKFFEILRFTSGLNWNFLSPQNEKQE